MSNVCSFADNHPAIFWFCKRLVRKILVSLDGKSFFADD